MRRLRSGLAPATTGWVWTVAGKRAVVAGISPLRRPLLLLALVALAGCRQDMHDQPKYKPYQESRFFSDGRASRPLVADTVARGQLRDDELLYAGKQEGHFSTVFPQPVTQATLQRGRERYDIYCSPCHDQAGTGQGMIVLRGYRRPPSMHEARLQQQVPGYFFDVITNGFGVMPNYAQQIAVEDRWAIVAYLRALQLSQSARAADVPAAELERLRQGKPASIPAAAGAHHD